MPINAYSAKDILFLINGVDFTPYLTNEQDAVVFKSSENRGKINQSLNGDVHPSYNNNVIGTCVIKIYSASNGLGIIKALRVAQTQSVLMAKNLAQNGLPDFLTDAIITDDGGSSYGNPGTGASPVTTITFEGKLR